MTETASLSFRSPPLVETVLGVQFAPIKQLTNAHLGVFWRTLSKEWTKTRDVPPLPQQFEQFGDEQTWGAANLQLQLSQTPVSRLQIWNKAGNRMIQVQNGRFHYNWLREGDSGEYPRYKDAIRPEFEKMWEHFKSFVVDDGLGRPDPNQWEITYVNHIPKGTVWTSPSEWADILPLLLGPTQKVRTVKIESCTTEWHFEIPPQRGRLHVRLQHERPGDQSEERLRITLTARGPVSDDLQSLENGLDLGHRAIVQSFVEITSSEAQAYWGRCDGGH